jgi:hypothetical protein
MSEPNLQPVMRRSVTTVAILVVAVMLAIGYSLRERSVARQNAAQNEQTTAALAATRSDVAALTAKINSLSQPAQGPAATPLQVRGRPTATVRVRPQAMRVRRPAHRSDDPRWKKVQAQLDEQGKQIESTRSDLSNARTELSGSIARTHEELVVLQKKGERNYYEFDIAKSKEFKRNGPLGIRLRKANTKNQYADLQLMVDDVSLTKKHVNLYEPVMFYTADGAQPAELVINSITKNHIRGYISEPKYRQSELAAMSNTTAQPGVGSQNSESATASGATSRRKLQIPQ